MCLRAAKLPGVLTANCRGSLTAFAATLLLVVPFADPFKMESRWSSHGMMWSTSVAGSLQRSPYVLRFLQRNPSRRRMRIRVAASWTVAALACRCFPSRHGNHRPRRRSRAFSRGSGRRGRGTRKCLLIWDDLLV